MSPKCTRQCLVRREKVHGAPATILPTLLCGRSGAFIDKLAVHVLCTYCYRIVINCRPMINAAFQWASSNGLVRKNPVHQEEEAKIVLQDAFELLDQTSNEISMSGSIEVEDSYLH